MAAPLETSVTVAVPPATVWRLLGDPKTWSAWWPGVREAVAGDHKPLHPRSQLRLSVQPGWMTIVLAGPVELCAPGRSLVWRGAGGGLSMKLEVYLEERPDGTRLAGRATFGGPSLVVVRLLGQERRLRELVERGVRGLRRAAEEWV